jgi:hypothetical protein
MSTRFGWDITEVAATIKQGSTGSIALTATVTKADGSALDSYSGWTADMKLYRLPQLSTPEIDKVPTIAGDAPNMQFHITIPFVKADTKDLAVGEIKGDVCMFDPLGNQYFPANVTLTIERSFSGT